MWSNGGYAEQPNGNQPYAGSPQGLATMEPPPGYAFDASAPVPLPHLIPAQPTAANALDSFDVPASLPERMELCRFLAEADLLPTALRKKPANLLLLMFKALALDVSLSVAIEHMHVVDGKVGHSAELLRALLYRNGHVLRWPTMSDKAVVGELTLRHDPQNPRTETFTIQDAARMELTGKSNWKKDPISMMVARCTTRLVSRHCAEVAVALGNLSAMDIADAEDLPHAEPIQATAEIDQDQRRDLVANELLVQAQQITSVDELAAIGRQAKKDGLLEQPVGDDGVTLQQALLTRINELSEAAKSGKPSTTKVAAE